MEPRFYRLLPSRLRSQLTQRPLLRRIIANIAWLIGDKILRLGVGVWIGAWVARHLGPEQFGGLNYAMAIVALFSAFATVGLPDVLIRDLVRSPQRRATMLASAFVMRIAGSIVVLLLALALTAYAHPHNPQALFLVAIIAIGPLAQATDVIDQSYQALNQVRTIVLLRNLSFGAISVARIVAIKLDAGVPVFAALTAAEVVISGVLIMGLARRDGRAFGIADFSLAECRRLLTDAWPLLVRLAAIGVYMRADQVIIGQLLGDRKVGIYAAAARLSEIWYLVPVMIMTAIVPRLAQSHHASIEAYERQLKTVMRSLFWLSVAVALVMSIGAPLIIRLMYGRAYEEAAAILAIHAWAGLFVTLGVSSNAWFVNQGLTRYGLYQALAGAMVGVALNLLLIPHFGIRGAAWAVVGSQLVSAVLFNLMCRPTRHIFTLQLQSIGFPVGRQRA